MVPVLRIRLRPRTGTGTAQNACVRIKAHPGVLEIRSSQIRNCTGASAVTRLAGGIMTAWVR